MGGLCWAVLCTTIFCATQKGAGMTYTSDPPETTQSEKETRNIVLPPKPFIIPIILTQLAQCKRLAAMAASLIGPNDIPAMLLPNQDAGGAGKVNEPTMDYLISNTKSPYYNATAEVDRVNTMEHLELGLSNQPFDSKTMLKIEEKRNQLIQEMQQIQLRAQVLRDSQQRSSADPASKQQRILDYNKMDLKPIVLNPRPTPKEDAKQTVIVCLCIAGIGGLICLLILAKKI